MAKLSINRILKSPVLYLLYTGIATAEIEIWTSRQGSTIQAEFQEVRDGKVVLRNSENRELSVNLSDLAVQ